MCSGVGGCLDKAGDSLEGESFDGETSAGSIEDSEGTEGSSWLVDGWREPADGGIADGGIVGGSVGGCALVDPLFFLSRARVSGGCALRRMKTPRPMTRKPSPSPSMISTLWTTAACPKPKTAMKELPVVKSQSSRPQPYELHSRTVRPAFCSVVCAERPQKRLVP